MEELNYNDIKEKLISLENGKYKHIILNKKDIEIQFGYLIFDVENKDKNKTLDAIAMCRNLGSDYKNTCFWLVQNTPYYPGTMRIELKMFVIVKRLNYCIVFNPNEKEDYVIPFNYVENKEDGELKAITLKYNRDKLMYTNLYHAFEHYFDKKLIYTNFQEKSEHIFNELTKLEIKQ